MTIMLEAYNLVEDDYWGLLKLHWWQSKFVLWVVAGTLMVFSLTANSQNMDFSSVQLNGSATILKTSKEVVLRLTPTQAEQAGSAFTKSKVNLADGFSIFFSFQMTNPTNQGGDGLVFVVQSAKATALGENASGIGYANIPKSIGIEFDTWNNGVWRNDSNNNHVGININGHFQGSTASVTPSFNNGFLWYVWIDYDGKQLEVRISQKNERPLKALLTQLLNLSKILTGTEAFIGFTASTGGAFANHDIIAWKNQDDDPELIPSSKIANYDILSQTDSDDDFKFIPGSKIALQADTGKWFSRCNRCQRTLGNFPDTITVHAKNASVPFAQFEVVDVGDGKIALKADTGKYVSRCRNCIFMGTFQDFVTVHVTEPAQIPDAQFTPELLENGKYALKADTGKYLSRCRGCSPGATIEDTVTIYVDNPNKPYAQWNVIFLKKY